MRSITYVTPVKAEIKFEPVHANLLEKALDENGWKRVPVDYPNIYLKEGTSQRLTVLPEYVKHEATQKMDINGLFILEEAGVEIYKDHFHKNGVLHTEGFAALMVI